MLIKLSEIASKITAYPAIKKLKENYPDTQIYILTFSESKEIINILNLVNKKNIFETNSHSFWKFCIDFFKIIYQIRKEKFDIVVDFEFFSRISNFISYLSGAPIRVGFDKFKGEGLWRGNFLTHKVIFNYNLHISQIYMNLIEAITEPPGQFPLTKKRINHLSFNLPKYKPTQAEELYILKEIKKQYPSFTTKNKIYLVSPNSTDTVIPTRIWPRSNYIKLIKKILKGRQNLICIIGMEKEKETAEIIKNEIKDERILDFASKTNLKQLLTLFALSAILITNDSGPSHFASLTSVKTITLFGPESPIIWKALSKNNKYILANLYCSPCINFINKRQTPCQDSQCMKKISVNQVWREIEKLLQSISFGE